MKKHEMTTNEQNAMIEEFLKLVNGATEMWIRAGEILIQLSDADPHVYDYIIEKCPTLNAGILGNFEKMGRRILHPQLLVSGSNPGYQKLAKLPFSLQERFIDEPVPLMIETDHGPDVLLVKARDLTRDQAKQVFASDRLRTEGEQRAYLTDIKQKARNVTPPQSSAPSYVIKNGKAIINGVEFTGKQLLMIASELTK